jgi:hypothetical protein
MPIAINGSGTITGISVGGIPDGTVDTDVLAANAVTYAKIGTTEQGQLCKAWVNFNGTGTVAIRASYNVSSITDNGVGDYTVNFATALTDANYCTLGTGQYTASGGGNDDVPTIGIVNASTYTPTSGSIRIGASTDAAAATDPTIVNVAIFR